MKTFLSILVIGTIFSGCYVDSSTEGGPVDAPFFLFEKRGSNVKITKGKTTDKLLEILDADTLEFDGRTLNLFQIKAPELYTESVKKSQVTQCTQGNISVIEDMGKLSKKYIGNKIKVNHNFDLDLRSVRDRYRIQIGFIYKKRDGELQTLGLSAVRNGYAVPSDFQSKYYTKDTKYMKTAQQYMEEAKANNKGLWKDYPEEMDCLAEINR